MRLLESSAHRQPGRAGMFVSVLVHTAVIALAVAGGIPTLPAPDLGGIPDVIPPPGAALDAALDPSRGLFGAGGSLAEAVGTGVGAGALDTGSPLEGRGVERQVALVDAPLATRPWRRARAPASITW